MIIPFASNRQASKDRAHAGVNSVEEIFSSLPTLENEGHCVASVFPLDLSLASILEDPSFTDAIEDLAISCVGMDVPDCAKTES